MLAHTCLPRAATKGSQDSVRGGPSLCGQQACESGFCLDQNNLLCSIRFSFDFSGNAPETRGTAFVVYEDIFDAKNACDHLSGFNVCNRYLVVLYYQSNKVSIPFSFIMDCLLFVYCDLLGEGSLKKDCCR